MSKRVLVVGGGIIGASVAWHLIRSGCAVTIVDSGQGGGLATRHSFAWINASWGNPEWYFHFRRRSMAGWRRLQDAIPKLDVSWSGGLLWDLPPAELASYAQEHARWGYGIREVGRQEALAIEPGLKEPPELALHVPEEGMLEPLATTQALLAATISNGARLLGDTEATLLTLANGRVTGIETPTGERLEADETVVCAGVDTSRLLEIAGLPMALDAPPGLIAHSTRSDKKLLNGLVMTPDFHVRQTHEGRLIIGTDFAGGDPQGRDSEMATALLDGVKAMVRGSDDLDLDVITVGYRPTPRDGYPAIGRPKGADGIYVAVLHSGITLAPIVGELAARELATGVRDPDLAPYDPNRPELSQA
ncbi:MAG: FAD-binding oxidoreductase [Rhizobiaceae bacterium]|nr:FAD-binding oxidoreductase [Rhizobiaceae bacterium]